MLLKIFYLLNLADLKKFNFFILVCLQTIIDLAGVGLIFPVVKYLISNDQSESIDILNYDINFQFLIILILALFLFKFLFSIFLNFKILIYGKKMKIILQKKLVNQYQKLDYLSFILKDRSYYFFKSETLTKDFSDLIISLMRMFSEIFVAIFIIFFLSFLNFKLLFILIVFFIISSIIFDTTFKKRLFALGKTSNKVYSRMIKTIYDLFDGFLDIKILNKEKFFLSRVLLAAKKTAQTEARIEIIPISAKYYLEFVIVLFFSGSVIFFFKFYNIESFVDSLPLIITFGVASIKLMPIFNTIIRSSSLIRRFKNTINILYKDFNKITFIKNNQISTMSKNSNFLQNDNFKELKIKSITYSFKDKKILDNANLTINKNDFIAFIGPSGSGKTSLVNIICGIYNNYKGKILINGNDLKKCSNEWKKKISYIPQNPFLIDESLKNNIIFDNKSIDNNLFRYALNSSKLNNLIKQNKAGINLMVGDKGSKISGGQRQRLLIARSLYHNREIIVFDESTSALDEKIEKQVFNDIKKLKGRFTAIFITHNKNILKFCNKVYELKNKKINEIKFKK